VIGFSTDFFEGDTNLRRYDEISGFIKHGWNMLEYSILFNEVIKYAGICGICCIIPTYSHIYAGMA